MVSYNPDSSFRIYISEYSDLILEDMNTRKTVSILENHYWPDINTPCWAPGGQEFAVSATLEGLDEHNVPLHFELYRVSVDGTVTQLTDMVDQFDRYTIGGDCTWSPDGKKIAFWLNTTDPFPKVHPSQANLAVVDIDRNRLTIYSIESTFGAQQKTVWSPDGQRLLLGIVQSDYQDVSTVLVDLAEGWVAHIADDMTPEGWMVNNP
jgi:Tol biopolymer transport system component